MSKRQCWMVRNLNPDGGGNVLADQSLVVRRTAAIGDVIAATVVADRLIQLGFDVTFQAHPATHCCLRRMPQLYAIQEPQGHAHVMLDGAYEHDGGRRHKHFSQMFFERATEQLRPRGIEIGLPLNVKPKMNVPKNDREGAKNLFAKYERPWTFVCPRSDHYAARQVPDHIWSSAAGKIIGTKFWIGRHPAPAGFVDLACRHLDNVITYLTAADLLLSVDTGPLHIGAALGVPILGLGQSSSPEVHLSDQCDFMTLDCPGLTCLNCQHNLCPINAYIPPCQNFDPDLIAEWANARLMMHTTENVSAIVAIYKPDVNVLNRCIECLLPQVQEIIVTAEANSEVPPTGTRGGKIRYVRKNTASIGYGRNANFGARHSTGKYLLLINDDVFLKPGAVAEMLRVMKTNQNVGIVSNLLWYPEGEIYHSGKVRSPNTMGWGHANYRQKHPAFAEPTEIENCCGACVLVPRKAYYEIDGYSEDEGFKIYAGDDDFCLRMRRAGYRIFFTPHSEGIHMEGQSTRKLHNIRDILNEANRHFGEVWGDYLRHNANRVPLGDFNY